MLRNLCAAFAASVSVLAASLAFVGGSAARADVVTVNSGGNVSITETSGLGNGAVSVNGPSSGGVADAISFAGYSYDISNTGFDFTDVSIDSADFGFTTDSGTIFFTPDSNVSYTSTYNCSAADTFSASITPVAGGTPITLDKSTAMGTLTQGVPYEYTYNLSSSGNLEFVEPGFNLDFTAGSPAPEPSCLAGVMFAALALGKRIRRNPASR